MDAAVDNPSGYPATGIEFSWMRTFRTVTTVLDFLYIFLMIAQKIAAGQFPSERFRGKFKVIFFHIFSGVVVVYIGCALHIQNENSTVSKTDDLQSSRLTTYYVLGGFTALHSYTAYLMTPKVMGEKRITIPLYLGATSINLYNGVKLLCEPNLSNAFLVWGSMNTFVYQRAFLSCFMFANVDWELAYTYSLIAGAAITYPLSAQDVHIYFTLAAPIVYAPFHEKIIEQFGKKCNWTEEDTLAGNKPTEKNILPI